jgi:hypothetical protein
MLPALPMACRYAGYELRAEECRLAAPRAHKSRTDRRISMHRIASALLGNASGQSCQPRFHSYQLHPSPVLDPTGFLPSGSSERTERGLAAVLARDQTAMYLATRYIGIVSGGCLNGGCTPAGEIPGIVVGCVLFVGVVLVLLHRQYRSPSPVPRRALAARRAPVKKTRPAVWRAPGTTAGGDATERPPPAYLGDAPPPPYENVELGLANGSRDEERQERRSGCSRRTRRWLWY